MKAGRFRHALYLVRLLVRRDLQVKYRNSLMGFLWSLLNPLLMMLILTFVFSHVAKVQIPNYPVFLLTGLLFWNVFAQSVPSGAHSIVGNAFLLKKVPVPPWVFPSSQLLTALVNFALACLPFGALALAFGHRFEWTIVQALPILALYSILTFGVTLFFASVNVFLRDIGFLLEAFVQILFYASAILFPLSTLPEKYRALAVLNPLANFVTAFRGAVYDGVWLGAQTWLLLVVASGAACVMGIVVYARLRHRFIYHL